MGNTVDARHLHSLVALGAQVEVVLEQAPQQLPAPSIEIVLQLGVRRRSSTPSSHPAMSSKHVGRESSKAEASAGRAISLAPDEGMAAAPLLGIGDAG